VMIPAASWAAVDPGGHGLEPGPSVGQSAAEFRNDLGDIRLGMQRIAFPKGQPRRAARYWANRRLAGTGHPITTRIGGPP